jgi:hypothetical protein
MNEMQTTLVELDVADLESVTGGALTSKGKKAAAKGGKAWADYKRSRAQRRKELGGKCLRAGWTLC